MNEQKIYELIILGAGPAGVAGAVYAHRKNIETLLVGENFGGQATVAANIANIPGHIGISGMQMANAFEAHIKDIGVNSVIDRIEKVEKQGDIFTIKTSKEVFQGKNILITFGRKYKDLGITNEEKYKGRGLFYCSTCDAALFKDKVGIVVGAGNTALNSVIDLFPFASKIYVITRGDAMRADVVLQEEVKKNPKVEIIYNSQITELEGEVMLNAIKYKNLQTNEEKRLETFGVFVNIGMKPNSELLEGLVGLNESKEIITDFLGRTSQKGIWAAGDVTSLPHKQISIAIGDGIRAVLDIYSEIRKANYKEAVTDAI
jgi:thioredoxin reductase